MSNSERSDGLGIVRTGESRVSFFIFSMLSVFPKGNGCEIPRLGSCMDIVSAYVCPPLNAVDSTIFECFIDPSAFCKGCRSMSLSGSDCESSGKVSSDKSDFSRRTVGPCKLCESSISVSSGRDAWR
eukprot:CAMPEP_0196821166 /NCGR_PEP_ID=MMETSP1362-20130617/78064_1 /TAXON_ID=163516 /ORGANISM="Leptocylindrus danicus, Strain CCMP1856" /LENGTH=126 /DNA_ID=CAMNT_0042200269 /DNA_START=915 /DNA_END=1295 /DNA_ORIENTATION=+